MGSLLDMFMMAGLETILEGRQTRGVVMATPLA